jgi:hypothetical protein
MWEMIGTAIAHFPCKSDPNKPCHRDYDRVDIFWHQVISLLLRPVPPKLRLHAHRNRHHGKKKLKLES